MKKILTATALALYLTAAAQAATTMRYQALICDEAGKPMPSASVALKVTVHAATPDGETVLGEEHTTTTTPAGMAYVNIGSLTQGTTLDDLDWAGSIYFLEVSIDRGAGYVSLGSQQIMSVPRALHAATAQSLVLTSPSGNKYKVTIDEQGNLATTLLAD